MVLTGLRKRLSRHEARSKSRASESSGDDDRPAAKRVQKEKPKPQRSGTFRRFDNYLRHGPWGSGRNLDDERRDSSDSDSLPELGRPRTASRPESYWRRLSWSSGNEYDSSPNASTSGLLPIRRFRPASNRPKTTSRLDSYRRRSTWTPSSQTITAISETEDEDAPSSSSAAAVRPQFRRAETATFDPRTKRVSWNGAIPTPSLTSETSADESLSIDLGSSLERRPKSMTRLEAYRKRLSATDAGQAPSDLSRAAEALANLKSTPLHRPRTLETVRRRLSWGGPSQQKDELEDYNLALARSMAHSTRGLGYRRPSTAERIQELGRRISWTNGTWSKGFDEDTSDDEDLSLVKIVSSETFQLRRTNSDTTALWATLNSAPLTHHIALSRPEIPQSSPLLSLPTELLQVLPFYLPASAIVSLRQTSSRLHSLYGLLPSSSSSSLSGPARFAFLTYLERDNITRLFPQPPPRTLCGHCQRFHPRSAFPSTMHALSPASRDCRQVWLCPHKSLSYTRASKILRPRPGTDDGDFRGQTIFPCTRCRDSIRHRAAADSGACLLTTKIALLQRPTPIPGARAGGPFSGELFPVREVTAALRALNFKMCPHINIGDPFLLSRFCRACLATKTVRSLAGDRLSNCISDINSERLQDGGRRKGKCKGGCFVRGCGTGYMFQARESLAPDASGRRQVWLLLVLYRWLGGLEPPLEDGAAEFALKTGAAIESVAHAHVDTSANPPATSYGDDGGEAGDLPTVAEDAETQGIFVDASSGPTESSDHEVRAALKSPKIGEREPLWMGHTVDAAERAEMRARWEDWLKGTGGGGRCLPDWGVCLLSGEDEGLKRARANAGLEGLAGILSERMG